MGCCQSQSSVHGVKVLDDPQEEPQYTQQLEPEHPRPAKARKGSARGAEDEDEEEAAKEGAERGKADPAVLAKRRMVRARRTKASNAPAEAEVIADSPPKAEGAPSVLPDLAVSKANPPTESGASIGETQPQVAQPEKVLSEKPVAAAANDSNGAADASKQDEPKKEEGQEEEKEAPIKVETKEDFWKVQVEAIYRRRNPHKMGDVPGLMEKYKGKEVVLYRKVCQRYDLDPKKLYADPSAWDDEDKDVKDDDEDAGGSSNAVPAPTSTAPAPAPLPALAPAPAPAVPSLFGAGSSIFGGSSGAASSGSSTSTSIFGDAGGSSGSSIFSASSNSASIFGSSGSTGSAGMFSFGSGSGSSASSIFGSESTTGIFGGSGAAASGGGAPSIFGGGSSGASSIFGASSSTASIFGGSSSGSSSASPEESHDVDRRRLRNARGNV
eukprot:TRINITY_DN6334_c0_g1_i1.p1 TRINITY_DN6334_c0_g1~~TRINITY_DN6334_c0_g1_i1.p1  ORF type:complete len:440 (+),score=147.95 TRINITY_DN6334_c0_g1_i1:31-1350(+)